MLMEALHISCNCAWCTTRLGQYMAMIRIMTMCVCMSLQRVNICGEMALTPGYHSVARSILPARLQMYIQTMNCCARPVNPSRGRPLLRSATRMVGAGIHWIPWDRRLVFKAMNPGERCLEVG